MANRFPLIFNSGAGQIQELAASDNLDLTSSNLVNAGILFTSSGSATAPSLQIGSGATYNPGLYSPGTDQLAISTGGSGRLFVDASGVIKANNSLRFANSGSGEAKLLYTGTSTDTYPELAGIYSDADYGVSTATALLIKTTGAGQTTPTERLRITAAGNLNFKGAGTAGVTQAVSFNGSAPVDSMVLTSGGLLGIGTSSPSSALDVSGAISLGTVALPSAGTARLFSRNTDSNLYIQTGSGNNLFLLDGSQNTMAGFGSSSVFFNTGNTTRLTIDSSGRVGIGTTSPDFPLQVGATGSGGIAFDATNSIIHATFGSGGGLSLRAQLLATAGGGDIFLGGSSRGDANVNSIVFSTANTARAKIDSSGYFTVSSNRINGFEFDYANGAIYNSFGTGGGLVLRAQTTASAGGGQIFLGGSARGDGDINAIVFSNANTERARIDSSGRLLVGTSSATGANSYTGLVLRSVTNTNTPGELIFQNGYSTGLGAGGVLGSMLFQTNSGNTYAKIEAIVDAADAANDYPGRLVFSTTADGASSPTERMRINKVGSLKVSNTGGYISNDSAPHEIRSNSDNNNVLIVSSAASNGTQYGLSIRTANDQNDATRDFLECTGAGVLRAQIRSNGGLANYQANDVNLSDRNAKKDISLAAGTWDCIKEWEIVNYRYKDQPDNADLNLGVIAQQVAESCPDVITVFSEAKEATEDQPAQEERLGIKEQQMYWMAIKALQEAQVRIEALEVEVAALKAQ